MDTKRCHQTFHSCGFRGLVNFSFTVSSMAKNPFFFFGAELTFILTLILKLNLEEKAAGRVDQLMREILVTAPQRLLSKLWPF